MRSIVLADIGAGLVYDQLPTDQLRASNRAGLDLVAGRPAVEPDDRL
ncbi:MAG: hypothetical protein LC808_06940 [Actinobacteria bacterium]|nr:hypothetical protein [Actinomycetota bacterium]